MTADRPLTLGEEIANAITHGVGLLLSLAGLPVLLTYGVARQSTATLVGAWVFAATMVVLYAVSTLYHALPDSKAKRVFHVFDHAAIYLLIAGTYTPFTLGVLRGAWGWTLFGVVWGLAVLGVTFKGVAGFQRPHLSTAVYVGMGWLVVVAARPLVQNVPWQGLLLLVLGGLLYTGGVGFYAAKRMRYAHTVWHLFVLAGNACHFLAVLWYAA